LHFIRNTSSGKLNFLFASLSSQLEALLDDGHCVNNTSLPRILSPKVEVSLYASVYFIGADLVLAFF